MALTATIAYIVIMPGRQNDSTYLSQLVRLYALGHIGPVLRVVIIVIRLINQLIN